MSVYISNKNFIELINNYQNTKSKKIYNEIAEYLIKIVNGLLIKPCFTNYSEDRKEEMRSDALYNMIIYMKNYSSDYSIRTGKPENPFSYFTQIAFNSFVQVIKKYQKRSERFISIDFTNEMGLDEMIENTNRNYKEQNRELENEEIIVEKEKLDQKITKLQEYFSE